MRVYDPRIGRFLSKDPLLPTFPYWTPYQFTGNMPIWANDLDGMEPNFKYMGDGILGVGLFDQLELGAIRRHETKLRIGKGNKQFQIQWLLNNDGDVIGYLASRIVPEEEYKNYYGGRGEGLQEAYVIEANKFFEFGKNIDEYYDKSRNAELEDVLYGEIERDPIKRLFDPRAWLLGRVAGATGRLSGQLFGIAMARFGAMTNAQVRLWYNFRLAKLNTKVQPTEANARALHAERNSIKSTARLLMKDRKAAEALEKSDPIRPFEYYLEKYKKAGLEGEKLWRKIIEGSSKANAEVNKKFGIQ